ncbi:hypothetical protein EDD21DRAFT_441864 [Dissophora ornata]|nr:hypothetical protein EDD21DRAFT_441864 [Dissophora ornata]
MSRDFKAGPRARANNFFDVGVVGRRTGITMKANIKKDADGLDNIDDFWDDDNDGNQPNNEPSDQEEYSDNDDGAREMSPQTRRRQQQAHGYVEQELPQELLSTPTSRRSRNVPMSKGSTSGLSNSVGGLSLLPNESMYDNAEEYQSPSFHAVKKRLVFTNDSSDIEPDQQDFAQDEYQDQEEEEFHQAPLRQTARLAPQPKNIATHRATGSPALDRLLNASRKKSAQIKAITAMGSPLSSLPISRTAIFPTTFMASRRVGTEAGRPKAFDFGSYGGNFDGEDDLSNGGDGDVDDSELPQRHEPITLPTKPTTAVATSMKTTTAPRMPSGFKRKGRSATARRAEPSDEDDGDVDDVDDDQIYHESESQYADDDRLQFSDEDQEVAYRKPVHEKEEEEEGEEEEEEEEEKEEDEEEDEEEDLAAPARKPQRKTKNVAQEQKVKTAGRSRKAVPDIIPKAKPIVATTSKKTSRSARGDDGVASALDESEEDNDDSQVPSFTHKASLKNRARNDEPSSDSRAKRKMTASANTEVRRREGRVELIEVPVVPDAGPEDSGASPATSSNDP